jgi:hypothetical protein
MMPCIEVGGTNVSQEHTVSILRIEDGIFIRLHNVITHRNILLPTSRQKMDVPPKCGCPPTKLRDATTQTSTVCTYFATKLNT